MCTPISGLLFFLFFFFEGSSPTGGLDWCCSRRRSKSKRQQQHLLPGRRQASYSIFRMLHTIWLHVWVVRSHIVEQRPSGPSPCPNKCLRAHEKKLRIQIALLLRNWKHCRGALFIFMGEKWSRPKLTSRAIWHRHITPIKTSGARADKSNVKGQDVLSLSQLADVLTHVAADERVSKDLQPVKLWAHRILLMLNGLKVEWPTIGDNKTNKKKNPLDYSVMRRPFLNQSFWVKHAYFLYVESMSEMKCLLRYMHVT